MRKPGLRTRLIYMKGCMYDASVCAMHMTGPGDGRRSIDGKVQNLFLEYIYSEFKHFYHIINIKYLNIKKKVKKK